MIRLGLNLGPHRTTPQKAPSAMAELSRSIFVGVTTPRWPARRQRVLRWSAAVAYLLLATGVPLPSPGSMDRSQPFPCMDHQCGCRSAEQCWRNCCCMGLEEKLAWAREHGVTPPDYVLAEARSGHIAWPRQSEVASCAGDSDRCEHHCPCCKSAACSDEHPSERAAANLRHKTAQPRAGVVLIAALGCQGVGQNWMGMAVSLPPPAEIRWSVETGITGEVEILSERHRGIAFPPSTPPPRAAVA